MTRSRSDAPSLPLRLALGLFRACASMRLAVVLIAVYAIVLAFATFVESHYGHQSKAVFFGFYDTYWFTGLSALLGLNVLAAAVRRFPWKRHQTGFVLTHAGILVLLFGCALTYRGAIDAQLPVFEGDFGWRALQDSQSLKLTIEPADQQSASRGGDPSTGAGPSAPDAETVSIPFRAGPFNWDDYDRMFPFPWCLARRDQGVVYDRGGIKLEVLDYYSDSRQIPVPQLTLSVDSNPGGGQPVSEDSRQTVQLAIESGGGPHGTGQPFGIGSRRTVAGGQRVVFKMTGSPAETDAFLDSRPQGPLGPKGQIVLHASGEKFHFSVSELEEKGRRPLGSTGLEVELTELAPQFLAVRLLIHGQDDAAQRMVLLGDFIEMNQQDYRHGVFGTYWVNVKQLHPDQEDQSRQTRMLAAAQMPRIDVLQGADGQLYYRCWDGSTVGTIAPLPVDGTEVAAFEATGHEAMLAVSEFVTAERPGTQMRPVAFERNKNPARKQRQVRLRLSVDGSRQEFWLAGLPYGMPESDLLPSQYRRTVAGTNRSVSITMPRDEIDVGFQVFLHEFRRKLDPGSHMVSHYSSLVDFRDRHDRDKCLQENVLITLNAPVNFSDPKSGRSYRLYQSSFYGPFKPGDQQFRQVVGGGQMRDRLFESVLSVNYDPGRGVKYIGCLMICAGILIMYYMKAYFFRRKSPSPQAADSGR